MFCPKCSAEYREGFTECSDCKVPLVTYPPNYPEHEMESIPKTELGYVNWVTVFSSRNLTLIGLAKSILDNAEIQYFARGESLMAHRVAVQLQVEYTNEKEARELLADLEESDSLPVG